jgi:hypothetical protein
MITNVEDVDDVQETEDNDQTNGEVQESRTQVARFSNSRISSSLT